MRPRLFLLDQKSCHHLLYDNVKKMDNSEYFTVIIVILRPELAKIRDRDWDWYQEVGKIRDRDWDWDSEFIFFETETETETQNIGIMRLRVSVSWVSLVRNDRYWESRCPLVGSPRELTTEHRTLASLRLDCSFTVARAFRLRLPVP